MMLLRTLFCFSTALITVVGIGFFGYLATQLGLPHPDAVRFQF